MSSTILDLDLYGSIVLAGVKSPGVVTITGHDRKTGWDVQQGQGQGGATVTRTGQPPVEFTCSFYLVWDEAQSINDFDDWEEFVKVAQKSVASATPKALEIYHPDLAEVGITSVVLKQIGGTVHDGKGGQTRSLTFIEYKPPKKKAGKPKEVKKSKKEDDPNAAALAELAALTKKYNETPWG